MNRRKFLVLAASTASAFFLTPGAEGQLKARSASRSRYASKDGLLDISLEASYSQVPLTGQPTYLFNYNGQVPGPLLEVRPGDTARIRFTNNLPQPTNLHYHGLHISPSGNADNVFIKVPSGETFVYEFAIPENHPAGTFWYHPHLHGLVAEQVFGGLAGLFVVRGELESFQFRWRQGFLTRKGFQAQKCFILI